MKKLLILGTLLLAGCQSNISGQLVVKCVDFCKTHEHGEVKLLKGYAQWKPPLCICEDGTFFYLRGN